jgi:NHLM bacteriocin system ABC transporter ATP-binding protein
VSTAVELQAALPGVGPPAQARADPSPFAGQAVELGAHSSFLVDGERVWLVERGDVDLFSVVLVDGAPARARMHVLRVSAGSIFGGLRPPAGATSSLLAVGTNGARVLEAAPDALPEALAAPRSAERARALLEGWVEALWGGLARLPPPTARCLEPGQLLEVSEPTALRAAEGVSWLRLGTCRLWVLGRPELIGERLLPLAGRGWILAQPPGEIAVAASEEPAAMWSGVLQLGALVWRAMELFSDEQHQSHRVRARRLTEASRAALERACARLAATVAPEAAFVATEIQREEGFGSGDQTALLACCRLVGQAIGVPIRGPHGQDGGPGLRNALAAILRSSRVRARRVALRGDWWRHDHGPLLAFSPPRSSDDPRALPGGAVTGERGSVPPRPPGDGSPVALLWNGRGYVPHHPRRGTTVSETVLDARAAADLAPFAYALYRPLPEAALGVRALVAFAGRGCGKEFLTVALMGAAATVVGIFPAFATGVLFNSIIPGAQRSQLLQITVLLLACALANTGFNLARSFALLRVQQRMGTAIQAGVWDRLMAVPLTFFRPYTAGDLAVRAMSIDSIQQTLSGTTVSAIMGGVFSLGNLAMMLHYSPTLAIRGAAMLGLAVAVTMLGGLLQRRPQAMALKLQAQTSGLVLQLLTSIGKLRVAGAEPRAFAQWVERFAVQRRMQIRVRRMGNWLSAFTAALPLFASVAIFASALPLINDRAIRMGDLLAFGAAFGSCLTSLLGTCASLIASLSVIPLYEHARPILDARPEVFVGRSDPGELSGDIELQHAVFRYNTDGPPVLRDVTLHVHPGEFVAFVGPSGSGKSTILKLLLGFETLESGAIYYDGQDVRGLDIQEVRRQIGVVLQNGRLISGDIFTNIVASGNATIEQAWQAAEMAGIAEDIKAMPMKMHTVINEGAGTLSGGQRQRLMIARAIVNRPRMLFFDEATSALDNRTQAIVSASLERLKATRIVIAHRLSTIVNADRIYVIDRGRIVQSGTYAELLKEKGPFADLARRQLM